VIDAYASALSLDAAALPTAANAPVRLAILDVNDDGKFDEADLHTLLDKLFTSDDTKQDYSRFDLNGDGFTGGSTTERFDLDRVGSTRFGATLYSNVMQSIEGGTVSFDENQLTDLEILCYYAYSDLYTGDPDARKQLTAGHCTISVTVDPAAVTLAPGGTQQFAATVRGTADPLVTWKVVEGDGSLTDTGLFTAGQTLGTATVRAISVVDPNAFGDATVTVSSAPLVLAGQLGQTYDLSRPDAADSCNFNEGHGNVSAFVKAQVLANGDIVIIEATGSRTVKFNGTCPCNGCDPEHLLPQVDLALTATTSGTITGGEWRGEGDLGLLILTGTLTQTRQAPDLCECTVVDPGTVITQDVVNLKGTPVLQAGRLVAIDFNSTTNSSGETTVTTGRLQ